MALGQEGKPRKPFVLAPRNLFDIVAANDVPHLLTVVRGINPYDISPGLQLILHNMKIRPETPNPYVEWTNALDVPEARSISEARDAQQNTALHVAAGLGHSQMIQILVQECFCDVRAFNGAGMTPFHLAVQNGRLECAKLLCKYGADPLQITMVDADSDDAGRTTMYLAHCNQHHSVVQFLEPFFGLTKKKDLVGELEDEFEEDEETLNLFGGVKKVKPPKVEPPFATLSHAARSGNAFCFAKMFDYIDCIQAVVGILPVKGAEELVCHLRSTVPHLLPLLLPKEMAMPPEKLFIFRGLFSRGFISLPLEEDILAPECVVMLVLKSAQVEAFRTLYMHGVSIDREHSFTLSLPKEEWAEPLRILILEVELRNAFEKAMAAYRLKHHSTALREKARYQKKRLVCIQRELEKRGLTRFDLPATEQK